jgi:glycosyltransferase involved in cell wall biosynthesis
MRVSLIGATHPCHNPRLIREADSLAAEGHQVRVVAPSWNVYLAEKDRRLMAHRKWQLEMVDFTPVGKLGLLRSLLIRGSGRLANQALRWLETPWLAERALVRGRSELIRLASSEPADWYIAHEQRALPVAAAAARRHRARLGFDCEDLLAEARPDQAKGVRLIEGRYLPDCKYVSAPSRAIAGRLQMTYAINPPLVLYNVFPTRLAQRLLPPRERVQRRGLRLHWFGQTIGAGRGLEDAIDALHMLPPDVELHVRGQLDPSFGAELESWRQRFELQDRVVYHPTLDHDDLIASMDRFDVGLALERPENGNYSRTVTNKLFSYLLAGLAVAATDTSGQREIMCQLPKVGFLYCAGDPSGLADGIRVWLDDRDALRQAQQAAWEAARERFCWDLEQTKLLTVLSTNDAVGLTPKMGAAEP